jgi:hypothetical protein
MAANSYHDEDACGRMIDGITLDDAYEARFKCDPYETRAEKENKLKKAELCFYRRVDAMSAKKTSVLSASNASMRAVRADNGHLHPIQLAYSYAKDCAHKLYGTSYEYEKHMNEYAARTVGDFLKNALGHVCIPNNTIKCESKCPTIFDWRDYGVWKARPLTEDELENELARIPFLDAHDHRRFTACMNDRLKEVATALLRSPKHDVLKKIQEQIQTVLKFLVKTDTNGRELYSRNRAHQTNFYKLKNNLKSRELNRIGNTTRSSRPYYKTLRTHIHTRRRTNTRKIPKNADNTVPENKIVYM